MSKQMTKDRPTFPFEVGDVVGWNGERCTVTRLPSRQFEDVGVPRVKLKEPDGHQRWVSISELSDPPQQATGGES